MSLSQDAPTTNKRICQPKFAALTPDGLPSLPPQTHKPHPKALIF